MLRLLLPILLLLLGIGGGVGAGMFLAQGVGDGPVPDAATADNRAEHVADDDHRATEATSASEFVRLNNQFVVPIVRNGSVRSLVVMALTLEVETGQNGAVFDREPRLRDAFLRVLFAHANAGGFDGSFTQSATMDPLREALREAAYGILGNVVQDVLIVDITRQDA